MITPVERLNYNMFSRDGYTLYGFRVDINDIKTRNCYERFMEVLNDRNACPIVNPLLLLLGEGITRCNYIKEKDYNEMAYNELVQWCQSKLLLFKQRPVMRMRINTVENKIIYMEY